MSSVQTDRVKTMLPSEALNRAFNFTGAHLPEVDESVVGDKSFESHAVRAGNIGLLLPDDRISELVENATVCRLPNTAAWFNGVISLRGNMIPVFDLHELFAINHGSLKRRLIAIGESETAVAFWVDDFPKLITITGEDDKTSSPPIPPLLRAHIHKYFIKDGQVWVDWRIESFFKALGKML